ncbi:MAG: exodeoxyribonuclease VII small subunit [Gammaproteobacteria bacterium RIFOXYB2_FULL_38_6]|nr:MAG: exodeoxyribonuclease VII small subunit [Gammaproteobacteria bacterium RIFOXYB2_FULL_38_6]
MATSPKKTAFQFEKQMQRLNHLVSQMEQGDLPLEDSLKYFEEGISIIRQCQKVLQDAEQKVKVLTS